MNYGKQYSNITYPNAVVLVIWMNLRVYRKKKGVGGCCNNYCWIPNNLVHKCFHSYIIAFTRLVGGMLSMDTCWNYIFICLPLSFVLVDWLPSYDLPSFFFFLPRSTLHRVLGNGHERYSVSLPSFCIFIFQNNGPFKIF